MAKKRAGDPKSKAQHDEPRPIDPDSAILLVVGAHLRAEVADRPLAYQLQQSMIEWLEGHADRLNVTLSPIVCSDVWYLNHGDLQRRPTISIGGPGVNHLSAFFANQLGRSTLPQRQVIIQIDPEFTDLRACIWGSDHELTSRGLHHFIHHYLDGFMRAAVTQVEPQAD